MVHLAAGDPVYQEGDAGMMMYVIQSGVVELFREVNGERISYGALEKGDFFGEMSLLLERQPRTTSAVVLEDADLVEIDATLFDKMIRGNIEIAVRMMRKLSLRLREREIELQAASRTAAQEKDAATPEPVPVAPPEPLPVAVVPPEAAPPPEPPRSVPVSAPEPAPIPVAEIPPAPEPPPAPSPPARSATAPPQTLEQVRRKSPDAHAVFAAKDGTMNLPLVGDEAAIGRFDPVTGMRPEIDVSAIDINRSVSRHHARVQRTPAGYLITEELGALNGTFVNETRLVTGEPTPIQDGDEVGFGVVRLQFHVF
jgi:outer membrane biosynthesis protein TonB